MISITVSKNQTTNALGANTAASSHVQQLRAVSISICPNGENWGHPQAWKEEETKMSPESNCERGKQTNRSSLLIAELHFFFSPSAINRCCHGN